MIVDKGVLSKEEFESAVPFDLEKTNTNFAFATNFITGEFGIWIGLPGEKPVLIKFSIETAENLLEALKRQLERYYKKQKEHEC